jgi:hypothetical protein
MSSRRPVGASAPIRTRHGGKAANAPRRALASRRDPSPRRGLPGVRISDRALDCRRGAAPPLPALRLGTGLGGLRLSVGAGRSRVAGLHRPRLCEGEASLLGPGRRPASLARADAYCAGRVASAPELGGCRASQPASREGMRSPIAWYPCREGARFGPEVASFASRRGDHRPLEAAMQATPIEELRKPHPDQQRIDSLSAQILRATALEVLRRKQPEVRPGHPVPAVGLSRR